MQCIQTSSSESLRRLRRGSDEDRISIATFISFAARGLSVTGIFCYQSIVSAGVTLILPGYTICEGDVGPRVMSDAAVCGSLELASKNIVAGSVRMVYAIIYSLFLVSVRSMAKAND